MNILCLLLIVLTSGNGWAANPYQMGRVDYFNAMTKKKGIPPPIEWHEPLPKTVANLLNDPSPENARAYLAWQENKAAAIMKAQAAIAAVQKKEIP